MALGLTPQEIVDKEEYPLLSKAERWERISLSDVAIVQNGFAFKSALFNRHEGMPLIRIRDICKSETEHRYIGEYSPEYVVNNGDILVGMDGDFTASKWRGESALLNQRVCRLSTSSRLIDERFFFLCLQPYLNAINAETSSVTVKHLSSKTISDIPLPLPPLNEQKRIVAKIEELFSELDNGIDALKTAREQLKVYRQAVLKHAFEGKLTAKWRKDNGISENTWQDVTVQDLALLGPSNGRSVKDRAGGFPVLRLTALKNGKIDLNEFKEGAWDKDEAKNYILNDGDFLFSRGNGSKYLVGRGGLVTKPTFDVAFPDTIMRIGLDESKVIPSFFSYLWESRLIRIQIESSARTTAGIYKINQQHVKSFKLSLPSLAEQNVLTNIIEEKLSVVDAQLFELEQQLSKSEVLRQSILKKAFSGQLVPQDPNDEPAGELLARIQAEKAAQKAAQKDSVNPKSAAKPSARRCQKPKVAS